MNNQEILIMKNIIKEFNTVRVLNNVDFSLLKGEVHSLVGANGAGKSTLMKILNGIIVDYEGEITFDGELAQLKNPREAFERGIAMIHQELDLVEELDVSENIYLGNEMCSGNFLSTIDRKSMRSTAQELLDSLDFPIRSTDIVEDLSMAQKQLVLIARTVAMNAKVIVMDEPTSSLSSTETEKLFKVIKDLCKRGVSIIYISHFLEEIFHISDRATVLRDGEKVITVNIDECNEEQLIEWMIGHKSGTGEKFLREHSISESVLRLNNLSRKKGLVKNISFEIKKGEVLGIAGVVGSGRTELARTIYGVDTKSEGTIEFDGKTVEINTPLKAVSLDMAYVPENRKQEGLVLKRTISQNISLVAMKDNTKLKIVNYKSLRKIVKEMIKFMRIKCTSEDQEALYLSGGNQQKVVIGKWLSVKPKLLILDQPTRGIDVGAKGEIYNLINSLALEGKSILFISDELEELIALSDRILIMKKGMITEEFSNYHREITKDELLTAMVN